MRHATRRQLLAACLTLPLAQAQKKRPSFIVLLTDDQRFDTVRALWGGQTVTPNMDRLARAGLSFTHASTQGGLTGAICMPSRAQLLTGRSVFRVHAGIVDRQENPDPGLATFPERLREQGYVTFATGKWHNGPVLFNRSFAGGDNIFFGGMTDQAKVPVQSYDPTGNYPKERSRISGEFSSKLFTDAAIDFLSSRDRSKPFLLYVAYTSPHDPRMAPKQFTDLFPSESINVPENFLPQHPFDNGEMKVRDELLAAFPRTEAEVKRHIAGYYAMIAEVDHQIGRVIDAIDKSPDAGDTYLIFAGDNGLAVGRHGLLGKQSLYEHSLRVPLIIRGPGVARGKRSAALCHLMDICPTIAGLAGASVPPSLEGRSLQPLLAGAPVRLRESVIAAYRGVQRAIRDDRYKLILYNVNGAKTTQLFDLVADPYERHNLANDAKHASRLTEMVRLLRHELEAAGDPNAGKWG